MPESKPRRTLGLFDAVMLVMGGIIGSGIFINPYVVARHLQRPSLILGVWAAGGLLALGGAFIWAELAYRLPGAGGQYLYLREAYHPAAAFLYGWVLLFVVQTGAMAAVAVTFARYFRELTGAPLSDPVLAVITLVALSAINCLGARAGSNVQSGLMLLKCAAIAALIFAGLRTGGSRASAAEAAPASANWLGGIGAAMIPIAFAYGGWQTSSFVAAEMRNPRRDLTRGLIIGVVGVIAVYLSANVVYLRVLGPAGLAATKTPASAVMTAAWGPAGGRWIACGIAVSTLGFLSQGILTAPRVYYAMAQDGLFFRGVGWISPRTGAPAVAVLSQGVLAGIIALSGTYEQLLNFVTSVDFISFGATAAAIFVFRRRSPEPERFGVPGHPITTGLFVLACVAIVVSTVATDPGRSAVGLGILLAGLPVYFVWSRKARASDS